MKTETIRLAEYFFWSPTLGTDAVRFSVSDAHGQEYFSVQPLGKSLRAMREAVGLRIHEAMEAGAQPGEIR